MTTYLILGITYAFAAAMQPGPFQAFVISQTLSRGWKRTLPAAFAPVISDAPIILLTLFLLSQLRTDFLRFLHLGGGLFLLYLTWRSFQTWQHFNQTRKAADIPGQPYPVQRRFRQPAQPQSLHRLEPDHGASLF